MADKKKATAKPDDMATASPSDDTQKTRPDDAEKVTIEDAQDAPNLRDPLLMPDETAAETAADLPDATEPGPDTPNRRDPLIMPEPAGSDSKTMPSEPAGSDYKTAQSEPEAAKDKSVMHSSVPPVPPSSKPKTDKAGAAKKPDAPEKVVERVIERRRGFLPALLGGILAAALGFFAARADLLDPILPEALKTPDPTVSITALRDDLTAQGAEVGDLRSDLDALAIPDQGALDAAIADVAGRIDPLSDRLDSVASRLDQIDARLEPLDTRLTELEKQPLSQGVSQGAIEAYERELAALQSSVADQRAEMEALVEQARSIEAEARANEQQASVAAQQATSRTAVAQLRAALDSGRPYADLLQTLERNGVDVPENLNDAAQDGVATMAALHTDFPPAARNALAAARVQGEPGSRSFGAFLQRQLGARSVAPREGDDPDAILSRAEAALTKGDLSRALDEIADLPDVAKPPLAEWTDRAQTRLSAIRAADDLAQSLNSN